MQMELIEYERLEAAMCSIKLSNYETRELAIRVIMDSFWRGSPYCRVSSYLFLLCDSYLDELI